MGNLTALSLRKPLLLLALLCALAVRVFAQNVYTVAGTAGVSGNANGISTSASFNNPYGLACDPQGNIYVANRFGHTIRKIDLSGNVTTFAGSGIPGASDGNGTAATFNEPWGIACDSSGNLYIADTKNYKIRKISPQGAVTTIAGIGTFGVTNGIAALAQFGFPAGIAVTPDGTIVYVSDRMTNTIRKIENGTVTTFAGSVYTPGSNDGQGLSAKFDHPNGLTLDAAGNILVADEFNNKIRKITPGGFVTTLAGSGSFGSADGPSSSASFKSPWGVCALTNGDVLVGDADNFTVRKISNGVVSVYAGQTGVPGMSNGPALQSTFNGVSALCVNRYNNHVYLCDPYSHLVRKVAPMMLALTTSGGNNFCYGTNINIQVAPSGLIGYKLYVDGLLAGNSTTGSFVLNNLPIGQHVITATASTTNGTSLYADPINISITPGLNVTIGVSGNSTICDGDSITLTSSIAGSYQWSNGATTQSITVTNAGSYVVTVTNGQGCSGTSPAQQVLTLQPPAASISSISATPNCPGDTIVLTAGAAPEYLWSNGDTTQSITVTAAGNYSVVVTNAAGCSAMSLPMAVNFHPVSYSSINPSGNVVVPQGSQTTLTAALGTSYMWSTGAMTQSIQVANAGTYTVTVTDNNGCPSVPATVNVSYLSTSNMVSVSGLTSFCKGDSVVLVSAFNTNNQWFLNGSPIAGATGSTYVAKNAGNYKLRYTPASSTPVFSNDIVVEVLELPSTLNTITNGVCPLSSANIEIIPVSGVSYVWFDAPSSGSIVANGNTFTTPPLQASTSYFVQQTNSFGCVSENLIEVGAEVYPSPDSDFNNSDASTDPSGYLVSFEAAGDAGNSYLWDFGDPGSASNSSSLENPQHIYSATGMYQVVCVVTSTEGCADTTVKNVRVALPDNVFIPNTFTPDGDGQNDVFRARGNNILYSDIQVFDQWGQNVCSLSKTSTGWNGESPRGTLPSGTYNYAIKVYLDNGVTSYHRGSINLIR